MHSRLATLALLLTQTAAAQPVLLDFDSIPATDAVPGLVIPHASRLHQIVGDDWRIALDSGAPFVGVVTLGANQATSGANGIFATDTGGLLHDGFDISGVFVAPDTHETRLVTDSVSIRLVRRAITPTTVRLRTFAPDGALLAEAQSPDVTGATLSISHPGIHSFILDTPGTVGFDDLAFNTPACLDVHSPPADTLTCPRGRATLTATAHGAGPIRYQWFRDDQPLENKTDPTLTILDANAADAGQYTCLITNPCGQTTTTPATLTVCPSDWNCDGVPTIQDFFDFLDAFFEPTRGAADFNQDGTTTSDDLFEFLDAYFTGCGPD